MRTDRKLQGRSELSVATDMLNSVVVIEGNAPTAPEPYVGEAERLW